VMHQKSGAFANLLWAYFCTTNPVTHMSIVNKKMLLLLGTRRIDAKLAAEAHFESWIFENLFAKLPPTQTRTLLMSKFPKNVDPKAKRQASSITVRSRCVY
jgi:hypothetical protein